MLPQLKMNQPRKSKKELIQLPITKFLVRESRSTSNEEESIINTYLSSIPTKYGYDFHNENTSPDYNISKELVYHTPVVDMTKVLKDKAFYSITPFKEEEEEHIVPMKRLLFDSEQKTDHNKGKVAEQKAKNKLDYNNFDVKLSEGGPRMPELIPFAKTVNTISSSESKKSQKKKLIKLFDFKRTSDSENTFPTTTDTSEHHRIVNRSKRAPNEIKVASLEFPVLIREPPLTDFRQKLNSLGILKQFSLKNNGFQEQLKSIGLAEVKTYVLSLELDEKSFNLKTCLYCGFVTESSLVLGTHLDVKHKNRFKQWPFCHRMEIIF